MLKHILIFVIAILALNLAEAACKKDNSINQAVQQNVEGCNKGSINQNIEQYVHVNDKKPCGKKGGDGINQNVGQVVKKNGCHTGRGDVNQQVHQKVVDGDTSIEKTTSQAVKHRDHSHSSEESSEEIIFRRHHCKGNKDEASIASSEEIKIHRGKHSSEIIHKKHDDIDGYSSEESSEEVKIIRKPHRRSKCDSDESISDSESEEVKIIRKPYRRPKYVSEESESESESYEESEEKPKTCAKRIVYRPAPKFCLKPKKHIMYSSSEELSEESSEEYMPKTIVKPCKIKPAPTKIYLKPKKKVIYVSSEEKSEETIVSSEESVSKSLETEEILPKTIVKPCRKIFLKPKKKIIYESCEDKSIENIVSSEQSCSKEEILKPKPKFCSKESSESVESVEYKRPTKCYTCGSIEESKEDTTCDKSSEEIVIKAKNVYPKYVKKCSKCLQKNTSYESEEVISKSVEESCSEEVKVPKKCPFCKSHPCKCDDDSSEERRYAFSKCPCATK